MRFLFILALLWASVAHADLYRLHDGNEGGIGTSPQAAVTYEYFNRAISMKWFRPGGDWLDADGVEQGSKAFATATGAWSAGDDVDIDVFALLHVDGITLKKQGEPWVHFGSRESTTPPRLIVSFRDGSQVEYVPTADSTITSSSSMAQGKLKTLNPWGSVVLRFPPVTGDAVAATLRLRVVAAGTGIKKIGTFAMVAPRRPIGPYGTGYASNYPGDVGIENDPRTLYYEGWEDPVNWWKKDGYDYTTPDWQWNREGGAFPVSGWAGMWIADGSGDVTAQCTATKIPRGTGVVGNGIMGTHCPDKLGVGVQVPSVNLKRDGKELEEAWARYYVKYDKSHRWFYDCDGGKAPGLSGTTQVAGNSGAPGWGLRGWSMRNRFNFVCDPDNPAYEKVIFGVYAYHGDILLGLYGSFWDNEHTLLDVDRWYCIEQRVKVNTPGVNDGVVQLFIDGRLVIDKQTVLMRSVKPEQGYGTWQRISATTPAPEGAIIHTDHRGERFYWQGHAIDSNLGIEKFWGMVHGGGKLPTRKAGQFWYDQTVIATERIGCMDSGPPDDPPPPPIKTELEKALEALAEAREDLDAANTQIVALQADAQTKQDQINSALAAFALAQERITSLEALISQIRAIVGGSQ